MILCSSSHTQVTRHAPTLTADQQSPDASGPPAATGDIFHVAFPHSSEVFSPTGQTGQVVAVNSLIVVLEQGTFPQEEKMVINSPLTGGCNCVCVWGGSD